MIALKVLFHCNAARTVHKALEMEHHVAHVLRRKPPVKFSFRKQRRALGLAQGLAVIVRKNKRRLFDFNRNAFLHDKRFLVRHVP